MANLESGESLTASERRELEALRREVAGLKHQNAAFESQLGLLETVVSMARNATEGAVLEVALQGTLDLCAELTEAQKGSLFLIDPQTNRVTDAILSREQVTEEQRSRLIGSVLDRGLAGWVVRHRQLGLIADTDRDPRWLAFPDQPYTARSALAVPIVRNDLLLGIITLLHADARHFNAEIARSVQLTADRLALVLENAELYHRLDRYTKALDRELETGRQIQLDFLPYEIPQPPQWEIAAHFQPARQVAGDFYDVFPLEGDRIGIVLADVCDKGVGAALFMALIRSLIRVFSKQILLRGSPRDLLDRYRPADTGWLGRSTATHLAHLNALQAVAATNDYITTYHWQMNMFATLFFGILEPQTGLLTYINAGHESLFAIDASGLPSQTLSATGPAIGLIPRARFGLRQIALQPGDLLFGYTDGITESKNPAGQLFGRDRLQDLICQPTPSARLLLDRLQAGLSDYIDNAPQFDDITAIVLHRHPLARQFPKKIDP